MPGATRIPGVCNVPTVPEFTLQQFPASVNYTQIPWNRLNGQFPLGSEAARHAPRRTNERDASMSAWSPRARSPSCTAYSSSIYKKDVQEGHFLYICCMRIIYSDNHCIVTRYKLQNPFYRGTFIPLSLNRRLSSHERRLFKEMGIIILNDYLWKPILAGWILHGFRSISRAHALPVADALVDMAGDRRDLFQCLAEVTPVMYKAQNPVQIQQLYELYCFFVCLIAYYPR